MFGLIDHGFSAADLDRFRQHQRVAFDVLEVVGASLKAGETEKQAARRIHKHMKVAGAQNFFHVPVALFGDRPAYPGDFGQLGALPTDRVLKPNDPVILDCAPIFDGYTVDTSFAMRFGNGGVPAELDRALEELRGDVLADVKAGLTMREIAQRVNEKVKRKGLENCHRKHIGLVLGHRVTMESNALLRGKSVWGLAPRQSAYFAVKSLRASRGKPLETPNWNHTRQSDCPPQDGLWAIEPHVAKDGFGAKFEDLLVIQNGEAYYLDNDLPHTRRWAMLATKRVAAK